jgi:Na+/melibiose symporter-like transporter
MALRIIFAAVPLILIVIAIYVAFQYKLIPSIHERLKKHLEKKRMNIAPTVEFEKEEQFLYKLLV